MEAINSDRLLFRWAQSIYRKMPIPRHWKNKYLAPSIFRLTGRLFRRSGAYHGWVNDRNGPLFDRLMDQYYHRWIHRSLPAPSDPPSTPKVSIIVLSHNLNEYTFSCLQAVLEHTDSPSFEFIVLDNGSNCEDSAELHEYAGVAHVIRSEENLGFSKGCNHAVVHARGEFLVFLNNDVIVTKGWLAALCKAMDTLPEAGIIAPKIIYADGTLQEAGGDVLPDGLVVQRGKADDSRRLVYNRVESVDYCSASAMLVRRKLFHRVEGFDEGLGRGSIGDDRPRDRRGVGAAP